MQVLKLNMGCLFVQVKELFGLFKEAQLSLRAEVTFETCMRFVLRTIGLLKQFMSHLHILFSFLNIFFAWKVRNSTKYKSVFKIWTFQSKQFYRFRYILISWEIREFGELVEYYDIEIWWRIQCIIFFDIDSIQLFDV
jgi:hypothetical protein